jgi:hypothetical protein
MLCYAPPRALWRASAGWDTVHDGCMRGRECSCAGWGDMVRRARTSIDAGLSRDLEACCVISKYLPELLRGAFGCRGRT